MVDPKFFERRNNSRKPSVSKLQSTTGLSSNNVSESHQKEKYEVASTWQDHNDVDNMTTPFKGNSLFSATPVNYAANPRSMTQLQSFDHRK